MAFADETAMEQAVQATAAMSEGELSSALGVTVEEVEVTSATDEQLTGPPPPVVPIAIVGGCAALVAGAVLVLVRAKRGACKAKRKSTEMRVPEGMSGCTGVVSASV